jgi:MerR family transcriptional regulator/heat shock protein HspR
MKKACYMIGVVSELLGLHPQTIRQYERQGLISPERTGGNTRRYSEEDLEKLRFITTLTRDMGLNLAGVEMIVNLKDEIMKLEQIVDDLNHRIQTGEASANNNAPVVIKVVRED